MASKNALRFYPGVRRQRFTIEQRRWHSYQSRTKREIDYSDFPKCTHLQNENNTDAIIRCGVMEFNIHKDVVCPQSRVFEVAFGSGFKETGAGVVELKEDNPFAVKVMLEELYGTVLIYADDFKPSKFHCRHEDSIKHDISNQDCCLWLFGIVIEAHELADKYKVAGLGERCCVLLDELLHKHALDGTFDIHDVLQMARKAYESAGPNDGLRLVMTNYILYRFRDTYRPLSRTLCCHEIFPLLMGYPDIAEDLLHRLLPTPLTNREAARWRNVVAREFVYVRFVNPWEAPSVEKLVDQFSEFGTVVDAEYKYATKYKAYEKCRVAAVIQFEDVESAKAAVEHPWPTGDQFDGCDCHYEVDYTIVPKGTCNKDEESDDEDEDYGDEDEELGDE